MAGTGTRYAEAQIIAIMKEQSAAARGATALPVEALDEPAIAGGS